MRICDTIATAVLGYMWAAYGLPPPLCGASVAQFWLPALTHHLTLFPRPPLPPDRCPRVLPTSSVALLTPASTPGRCPATPLPRPPYPLHTSSSPNSSRPPFPNDPLPCPQTRRTVKWVTRLPLPPPPTPSTLSISAKFGGRGGGELCRMYIYICLYKRIKDMFNVSIRN